MRESSLPLILILLTVSIYSQGIPQIQPTNTTLGTTTDYVLNYFSLKNIPSTTIFTIEFSNSDI